MMMTNTQHEFNAYENIIRSHPLFSNLDEQKIIELTQLFQPHLFGIDETIVKQDDLVDSIYFIVSGEAEVRREIHQNKTVKYHPLATIREGESIGLSATGLFSTHGQRSATVIALSPVIAIRLNLIDFKEFIKKHPFKDADLQRVIKNITRLKFIKELTPFKDLAIDRVRKIAEQITEVNIPADTILFKEGDVGDACYLLEAGSVDIIVRLPDGTEKIIATVKPPGVIGEAALLSGLPRNATAHITEKATLLKLDATLFNELTASHTQVANALMRLQNSRLRPTQVKNIEVFEQDTDDGERLFTLRNIELGEYFQLTESGKFIWDKINGENTLMDIAIAYNKEFDSFNPNLISQFIVDLSIEGFIELKDVRKKWEENIQLPFLIQIAARIANIMEYRVAFGNADEWITRTYQKYAWLFFTKPAQLVMLAITLYGLIAFLFGFEYATVQLNLSPIKWPLFIGATFATSLTIPIHELAHAYTTKYYGRIVHCFGVGWLWLGPFAFCDTSDMWLAPKSQRIVVDLVGLYVNAFIAGIAGIIMFLFPHNTPLFIFLWLFALSNYTLIISNLYTGIELDGYYALMDAFDVPNLRIAAIEWLTLKLFFDEDEDNDAQAVEEEVSTWEDIKTHLPEITYWLLSFSYIIFIETVVTYVLIHYLLYGLFSYRNPYVTITLVLLSVALSSLKIYTDLLKKRKMEKARRLAI